MAVGFEVIEQFDQEFRAGLLPSGPYYRRPAVAARFCRTWKSQVQFGRTERRSSTCLGISAVMIRSAVLPAGRSFVPAPLFPVLILPDESVCHETRSVVRWDRGRSDQPVRTSSGKGSCWWLAASSDGFILQA